jgi:hypothetical protein
VLPRTDEFLNKHAPFKSCLTAAAGVRAGCQYCALAAVVLQAPVRLLLLYTLAGKSSGMYTFAFRSEQVSKDCNSCCQPGTASTMWQTKVTQLSVAEVIGSAALALWRVIRSIMISSNTLQQAMSVRMKYPGQFSINIKQHTHIQMQPLASKCNKCLPASSQHPDSAGWSAMVRAN